MYSHDLYDILNKNKKPAMVAMDKYFFLSCFEFMRINGVYMLWYYTALDAFT